MRYLDVKLGPLLIGTFLDVVLLGMMVMQVHVYVRRFWQLRGLSMALLFHVYNKGLSCRKDENWIKFTVLFLLIADTAISALNVAFLYQYTIRYFGNYAAIRSPNWNLNSDLMMTIISSFVCQTLFAWHIKLSSGRNWLSAILLSFIFIQFLMGITTAIIATVIKVWIFDNLRKIRIIVIIWLSLSSITNTALTTTLFSYLRPTKAGQSTADTILGQLSKLTMQTGLIVTIWTIIDFILYLSLANSLHLMFNLSLGKLYTNSLMSILTSREQWRREMKIDNRVALQKAAVGESDISMPIRSQRVIWEAGTDDTSHQNSYLRFGAKNVVKPDNNILVTSSTIVHRDRGEDDDQSDVQVFEDPQDLTVHDHFVNPSSSHLIHPTFPPT